MVSALLMGVSLAAIPIVMILVFVIARNAGFKHKILWLRQTGDKSFTWSLDAAKLVHKNGRYYFIFKKVRAKYPDLPYKYWSFFVHRGSWVVNDEEMNSWDMKARLKRGLILAELASGDIKPAEISVDGNIKVIDYDITAFIVEDTRQTQSMTMTGTQKLLQVLIVAGVWVMMGISFVLFFVFFITSIDKVCGLQSNAAPTPSVADKVQGVIGG